MNFSTDQNSVNQIKAALQDFEVKLQRRILRKGLRALGNQLKNEIQSNITHQSKVMRRSVRIKVKTYKRGKLMWMGVGFPVHEYPDWRTPVKARCYNNGWRPYPKGRKQSAKGKGWRKGQRKLGGTKIYETQFLSKVYNSAPARLEKMLYENVLEVIKEQNANA